MTQSTGPHELFPCLGIAALPRGTEELRSGWLQQYYLKHQDPQWIRGNQT